jgi:hypothetical protein
MGKQQLSVVPYESIDTTPNVAAVELPETDIVGEEVWNPAGPVRRNGDESGAPTHPAEANIIVQSEPESSFTERGQSKQEALHQEGGQGVVAWEQLDASCGATSNGNVVVIETPAGPTQSVPSDAFWGAPQQVAPSFETASWMDTDFIVNGMDWDDGTQHESRAEGTTSTTPGTSEPAPVPSPISAPVSAPILTPGPAPYARGASLIPAQEAWKKLLANVSP